MSWSAPASRSSVGWVREADWRGALISAAAVLLAALVGALLVVLSGWLVAPHNVEALGDALGLETFARSTALSMCTAFFGGAVASVGGGGGDGAFFGGGAISVHVTPLGSTALLLATTWFVVRRQARGAAGERRAFAGLVTALVTAAMLVVALLSRIRTDVAGANLHADVVQTVIGALLLVGGTALLAAEPVDRPLADLLGRWLPLLRAGLIGVAVACVAGWVAVVVSVLLEANAADASLVDALRLLPASLAYLPNLGLSAAHLGVLGSLSASVGAFFGSGLELSLLERHGLSAWYWLYVLIPLVAAGYALVTAARSTPDAGDRSAEVRRSLLLLAAPFAGIWLILAVAARVRVSVGGLSASAGITLWQALLLPTLVIGLLALLLARRLADQPVRRVGTRRRASSLTPATLALTYVVIALLLGAGSALADRGNGVGDGFNPLSLVSSSAVSQEVGGSASVGVGTHVPENCSGAYCSSLTVRPDAGPDETLMTLMAAEKAYFGEHQRYSIDIGELGDFGFIPPPGQEVSISGTGEDYCATVSDADDPEQAWTFSSESEGFVQGRNC